MAFAGRDATAVKRPGYLTFWSGRQNAAVQAIGCLLGRRGALAGRSEYALSCLMELEPRKAIKLNMKALVVSALLAFVAAANAGAPVQPSSNAAAQPAAWLQHDLIVSLHNLPKTYSCNDLWYKFRDVLLELGARADYKILPYDCNSRSPQVQLKFMLPQALTPAQKQYADLNATPKTVELQPGKPSTLKTSDCDLVSQMNSYFFPAIPLKVVSAQLECKASGKPKPYEISVAALTPEPSPALAAEPSAKSSHPARH